MANKRLKIKSRDVPELLSSEEELFERLIDWGDDHYGLHIGATLIDTSGNVVGTASSGLSVTDTWTPTVIADIADDDSDKTLTVPASTTWQPLALHITLTTTATAGNRQLAVLFTTADDAVLAEVRPSVVQAESLTRTYSLALGVPDDLVFYDTDLLRTPLPLMMLPAGYKIRVYDNNAVDAAADDLHIQLTVLAR